MTSPKKVALIGLGTSRLTYGNHTMKQAYQNHDPRWDEVWTMNAAFPVYHHDRLFMMDDLRVQAARYPKVAEQLKRHDKSIITTIAYPEFPTAVRYPIEDVVKATHTDFFTNTASYAIAYALATGVKDLFLYGCDFAYPDAFTKEMGGQSAAFLLGMARSFGMRYYLPDTTTLLGASSIKAIEGHSYRPLYGYLSHPLIKDKKAAWNIQQYEEVRKKLEETGSAANTDSIEEHLVSANEH